MEKCSFITIHAGENQEVENIWEAVYHLNADRIGHGLTLGNNPKLMQRFRDKNIFLEMCPSSNEQIVGFNNDYPLKEYLENGVKVTINTDNIGISRTNFSNEYIKASKMTGGLSIWAVLQTVRNSFKGAFLNYGTKQKLILKAEEEISKLAMEV